MTWNYDVFDIRHVAVSSVRTAFQGAVTDYDYEAGLIYVIPRDGREFEIHIQVTEVR